MGKGKEELEICAGGREVDRTGVLAGAEDGAEDLGVEEGGGLGVMDDVGFPFWISPSIIQHNQRVHLKSRPI